MIFKRKIYDRLKEWKETAAGEKALLIEGARRIGKSTIVGEFGKREYKSVLTIDFNDASDVVKEAFDRYLGDLDTFFMILSAEYNVTLYPHKSLVIFDEIQRFPKARQSIKKLVADGRFDYIETGSLISIRENVKNISIPSEERKLKMYPMDFEEFCLALGEGGMLEYIRDRFEKRKPLEEGLHHKAMLLFKQFMLVGGMPKVVEKYLTGDRNFEAADREKRDILALYRDDIGKIDRAYRSKVLSVFDQIPAFLSRHEKRVRLSNLEGTAAFPAYQDTFFWLGDSMIANECFNCADPNIGLSLNEERAAIKCYMGDTGLLVSHAFDEKELAREELYKQILHDRLSINEGMLFENAIAQSLTASGHKLFFYTHYNEEKHRNDMEIDFLIGGGKIKPKLYPIEVKSGKRYTIESLRRFTDIYSARIGCAYIVHTKNLTVTDGIVCLPAYMAHLL